MRIFVLLFCTLALLPKQAQAQTAPQWFAGLKHTPQGSASLSIDPLGRLVVSNIGSTGQDGVAIDLTQPDGFFLDFDSAIPANQTPDGVTLAFVVDGPTGPLGSVSSVVQGGSCRTTVDFSAIGSPTHTVQVLNDDQLVAEATGMVVTFADDCPSCVGSVILPDGDLCMMFCWPQGTTVQLDNQPPVAATQLLMISDATTPLAEGSLVGARLLFSGMSQRIVVDEGLNVFGLLNRALGQAQLTASFPSALSVSNIGSSGDDGVRIDSPNGVRMHWNDPTIAKSVPVPEASQSVRAFSQLDDQTQTRIPTHGAEWTNYNESDPGVTILQLFAFIGATNVKVQVLEVGVVVTEQILSGSVVGEAGAWPTGATVHADIVEPAVSLHFDVPAPITFPNQQTATGDEVRIEAVDATVALDQVLGMEIRGKLLPPILLQGPFFTTPAPPLRAGPIVLQPPWPNPFNPSTRIGFSLARPSQVRLDVFSASGRHVVNLLDDLRPAGDGFVEWRGLDQRGRQIGSGTYLIRLISDGVSESRKITLLK